LNFINIFQIAIILLLGISFGSFLNVVIDRFATNRSIVKGRSYCESCKKTLQVIDLIPLLSFIFLKGRCRFCGKKIPSRLFVVELVTGILSVTVFVVYAYISIPLFLIIYLITLLLVAIFFIDLSYGIIPDKLSLLLTIVAIIFVFISGSNILIHFLSGMSSFLFFYTLFVVTKGKGMGGGDLKIAFALGLILGYPFIIYGLYLAFLTGAIISIILVLWKKKKLRGDSVPFGPFLVAATLFTLFFGEKILQPLIRMIF